MDTYKATNTKNGKFYIGSTTNFARRKTQHLSSKDNYPFQSALRADPEAFEWEVWSDNSDEPILEQALLDMWFGKECCYNLNPNATKGPCLSGPDHPFFGKKRSDISERMSGEKHPMFGKKRPEHSKRMSGENNPMFGKSNPGLSGELNPMYGRKRPDQAERAAARKGELHPMYGKKRPEHAKRMSEAMRGESNPNFGKVWWVNENGETRLEVESPGLRWQRGRKWKG